ncbi:MAG: PAS domain-containing protein [Alphaproteobacteria bacterium]|nr:PAS domain-containing protein [Alphaproteobacteria bacterium]
MTKRTITFLKCQEFREILVGPEIVDFFDYWNRLRASRCMPERPEVDPVDVPRAVLPHLYILVRDPAGDFRFRLAGTRMAEVFGRDITGKRVVDVLRNSEQNHAQNTYKRVVKMGKPSHSRALYKSPLGGDPFLYQRLTLPLGTEEETTHLLGALILRRESHHYEPFCDVDTRTHMVPTGRVETMMA